MIWILLAHLAFANDKQECLKTKSDTACASYAVDQFFKALDYQEAKNFAEIGCIAGGKQSCALVETYLDQLVKACKKHQPGSCKELKNENAH